MAIHFLFLISFCSNNKDVYWLKDQEVLANKIDLLTGIETVFSFPIRITTFKLCAFPLGHGAPSEKSKTQLPSLSNV